MPRRGERKTKLSFSKISRLASQKIRIVNKRKEQKLLKLLMSPGVPLFCLFVQFSLKLVLSQKGSAAKLYRKYMDQIKAGKYVFCYDWPCDGASAHVEEKEERFRKKTQFEVRNISTGDFSYGLEQMTHFV